MTVRRLRKYEYTDNSRAYLNSLDKVMLLMDKEIKLKINLWYLKIYQESMNMGLDLIGYHYLLERLEKREYPIQITKNTKETMTLFLNARFYDNSLKIHNKSDLVLREMKGYSRSELKEHYGKLTDTILVRLSKHLEIYLMKIGAKMFQLTTQHCRKVVDRKTCLYFKDDMIKSIGDRDFRVSYNKVNTLFTEIMRKV